MRREGRRHGIIRTYRILPPPLNPRLVNSLTSPLTTGLFTKLPSKPTKSHRKVWSGQVHWVRSNDTASSSYKLLTWRVVTGPGPVSNLPGFSGSGIVSLNSNVGDCEDNAGVETMKTESNEDSNEREDGGSQDDDESVSFYDVGMMMMMDHMLEDDDEEDGWCLV